MTRGEEKSPISSAIDTTVRTAFVFNKWSNIADMLSVLTAGIIPSADKWVKLGKSISGGASVLMPSSRSETDINIRVSSDPGSIATIDKVKKKRGDAAVNVSTIGYTGAY
ncbi:MAG TPA: hypothetical protein ENH82_09470 [bacterium]|nr:hypothetical protein [bacterium]